MRHITIGIILLMLLATTASVEADGEERTVHYTGANPFLTIWCAEGGHEYTPIGDPDPDDNLLGWVFSGEPECLPGDTLFGTEHPHGIGGGVFCVRPDTFYNDPPYPEDCDDHTGHAFSVVADDLVGPAPLTLHLSAATEDHVWESCGSATVTIPEDLDSDHWGGTLALMWVHVDAVRLDADHLEVCTGSHGSLHATY